MLEQLLDLVKGNVSQELQNNSDHQDVDHDAVSQEMSSSVLSQISDMAKGGEMGGIMELFNGKDSSSSGLIGQLAPGVISSLMQKFGLGEGKAAGIVTSLLPSILNMFNNKVNNAQQSNGFDISSIIGSLMNNQGDNNGGGGIADIIGKLVGGNQDSINEQNQNNTDNNGGGGIMDTLKGLFN